MQRPLANIAWAALASTLALALPVTARGACCIEGCGSVPWTSCTNTNQCTGGVCPGPLGSAIAFDENGTCGEGMFSSCPPTEVGECADGVNNDEWTGDLATDCADPDCVGDPNCPRVAGVPAAGGFGLAATALALFGIGVWFLRSRLRV